ncbi:MAG: prolyl oligopeptidase family serine peptidase [Planctomycetota bacterium]
MRTSPTLAAAAALASFGPLLAQTPGITPEQVLAMRSVALVAPAPDGNIVAFTRIEPRPGTETPGSAYLHLFAAARGADGAWQERLLLGGGRRVGGVAWDPQSGRITFRHRGEDDPHTEVWSIDPAGGEPTKVTTTPHGVGSYEWSPTGDRLAYVTSDPLPEARAQARSLGFRQVVVEEDYVQRSLWVWDRASGESRRLTEGPSVSSMHWSPDGRQLACGIAPHNLVDDGYMFVRLHVVDVATGERTQLVDNPGKLGAYAWSPSGQRVAYISAFDRNDPHAGSLFVVDLAQRNARCLTTDLRGMVRDVHWLTYGDREQLQCVLSRGVKSHLATLDPDDGKILDERSPAAGAPAFTSLHAAARRPALRFFAGSTAQHPNELWVAGLGESEFRRITDSNPWLSSVALGQQEVVRFRARDGLEIEGLLMHPVGRSESDGRAPLVIVAHGGPESHFSDGWNTSYSSWGQLLAARGYFAWLPNYRASTGYGVAFAKADHGDPMGAEFTDHLDAIAHFDGRGLIDPKRVGVGGGSYGGYTAAWAATRQSDHFAAAVSFVPFVDIRTKWYTSDIPYEFFYVHYQEKWPHEQPGLLADRSPLSWAAHCRTPLLLLGGTADPRVHPSQPFMLYRAVKFATATPVRYVQYPGEGHGNRTNVYQYDYALRTLRWFDHYLKPGDRRAQEPPPFDVDYGDWGKATTGSDTGSNPGGDR